MRMSVALFCCCSELLLHDDDRGFVRVARVRQAVRRLPDPVLGAGDVHGRDGTVHGELLLGAEHLLDTDAGGHPQRDLQQTQPTDWLLPVGAVHTGHRGAALLHSLHPLARHALLALR